MSTIKKRKSACYCINLRRAANSITDIYDRILQPTGLSVNQYSLLMNISRLETCSVSDLANYVGLERTTLVRSLKPLFDMEYIEDTSLKGQRNRQLRVTKSGQQILQQAEPLWRTAQTEIEQRFGKEKMDQLTEILSLIVAD